jgi:glycosyltransferase involved in cell wall biosynthesis
MLKGSPTRVVILHNIISPHVTPVFQELAKICNLTVVYCAESESNRHWSEVPTGFEYQVLRHTAITFRGQDVFTFFINPGVITTLNQLKPDLVILSGWDNLSYLVAALYCRIKSIPYLLHSGSTQFEPSWRRTISRPLVQLLVAGATRFISYGTRASQYLISLGADSKKITPAYNSTRPDFYHLPSQTEKQKASQLRRSLSISAETTLILFYGQLIERKGVDILLNAVSQLQQQGKKVGLLIVGRGTAADALRHQAQELQLTACHWVADPGDSAMTVYFHASDIFVLPSREEVWGLVVNQAMMSGLPVIVSDRVGAGPDLVIAGETGYVFANDSVNDLTTQLLQLVDNPSCRMDMGKAAAKRVAMCSPVTTAQAMYQAIKQTINHD